MQAASVRAAVGAVSFLTRVPVGRFVAVDAGDVSRGSVLFPAVGAGVGVLSAGAGALLQLGLPSLVAAALGVAVGAVVTGGMHLDALADTFDAAGAVTRSEALVIMRDPRLGSFGATALVLDLLVKVASLSFLLQHGGAIVAFVSAGALSRAAAVALAALLPYARPGAGGLSGASRGAAMGAAALAVAAAASLARGDALWLIAATVAAAVTVGVVCRSWLGGVTGDTLGAAIELSELTVIAVAVGLA